jgi:hypothetical protein
VPGELPNVPIAITGMHRSGTSMVTRALHDSGLHLIGEGAEHLIQAAEDNPEGFWENKAIVACNEELLEATGGAWDNPPDLPPQAVDDPRVLHIAEASTAALTALREYDKWGFKDPRTCLTAAYWLDLQPDLRFIICVRHPLEVALSLKRRNQNSYSLGLALWERYYATVLDVVPRERRLVTHYDTYFLDPEGEVARLCAFAGLVPAPSRVRTDLRHHTIGVGLADAGVSSAVRALYSDLCREAGAPQPPEPPADQGRVRRLILDGAVAQRHAEQRQDAIERLEEREAELRAAATSREAELQARIRELESTLSVARRESTARLEALQAETIETIRALSISVARAQASGRGGGTARVAALRVEALIDRTRDAAKPLARRAGKRLPAGVRLQLRRADRLVRRGIAEPRATAQLIRRRAVPRARAAVVKLISRGQSTGASVPKGPPFRAWKDEYQRLVATAVPAGAPWLVLTPGSPPEVRAARQTEATPFPDSATGRPFDDDLAHIAQLEAQRFGGHRHLVVPEGSRRWLQQQTELRDHLTSRYRSVTDQPGAGAVYDLAQPASADATSLRGAIDRLANRRADAPAVLDWTGFDLGRDLPDLATFRPSAGDRLLYLDRSVDIVVVDESRDLAEARRVAALGVISLARGPSGLEVRLVEDTSTDPPPASLRVLVRSTGGAADDPWRDRLQASAAEAGADLRLGPLDPEELAAHDRHDVVIVVERDALPLPGAIEAAARYAAANPSAVVTGKVLRADGRLEAAGGTVFSDRSVALIGANSPDVRAPWLEYLRPVCWATGLAAAATSVWSAVPGPAGATERTFLREWCADVWANSGSVVYHPSVATVRVAGDGSERATPMAASRWQRVLDLRPRRPAELSDGAWRYLLAHDDVGACRG